jgi:hypothetical protein
MLDKPVFESSRDWYVRTIEFRLQKQHLIFDARDITVISVFGNERGKCIVKGSEKRSDFEQIFLIVIIIWRDYMRMLVK